MQPKCSTSTAENSSARLEATLTLERGALGAAILEPTGKQARILADYTSESDWASPLHRAVFRAIRSLLAENSVPLEYCSVCAELIKQGVYDSYTNCVLLIVSLGEGIVLAKPMSRRIMELRGLWNARKEAEAAAQ